MKDRIDRSATRVRGFRDPELDFQLLRQLGATAYGGASVGECFHAASLVKDETPAQWADVFARQGLQLEEDADARARRGHAFTARDQYWKACNAYRAAEYFTFVEAPSHRELGLKSRDCFGKAMRLNKSHTCEEAWIPFEDITLPAYFMAPDASRAKRKTIAVISGYDGTMEESYLLEGRAALERGYNLFLLCAPGQMDALRFHPERRFRPDFEKPISATLDWLLKRPEVEPAHVALHGVSMGGYFCLRAAAHDERIRALIPNSPIVDWRAYIVAMIGDDPATWPDANKMTVDFLRKAPPKALPPVRAEMTASMVVRFGQRSFGETMEYLREFHVDGLERIRCPCFARIGAGEGSEARRQADVFAKKVRGEVTTFVFTEEQGADAHCQVGNTAFAGGVTYDWLDEHFG